MQIFHNLLAAIAKTFDLYRVPYMVIGGQAVLQYGRPRLTEDIDITLGLDTTSLPVVQSAAAEIRLTNRSRDPEEFARKTNVLPLIDEETGVKVDCIFSFTPYERQAIARSKSVLLAGHDVSFAAVEDVIIHKLVANRPRDIEDIVGILAQSGNSVDMEYLGAWLRSFSEALGRELHTEFENIENILKRKN